MALRQQRLLDAFRAAIGPFPEHAPLAPQVTGRVDKPGYAAKKVVFTSQPGIFVTVALFLPDQHRFPKPWPAVLMACGRWQASSTARSKTTTCLT